MKLEENGMNDILILKELNEVITRLKKLLVGGEAAFRGSILIHTTLIVFIQLNKQRTKPLRLCR